MLYNTNVCCVFSLQSLHRGDSNEFTKYTIFNKKNPLKITLFLICVGEVWDFSKGLKNEFETAVVNRAETMKKRFSVAINISCNQTYKLCIIHSTCFLTSRRMFYF